MCVCVCVWLLSVTASFQSSVWRLRALRSVKTEDQRETLPPFSGGGEEGGGGSEAGPSPPTFTFSSEVPKMFWQRFNSDSLTQTLSLVSIFLCILEERRKQSSCCYLSIVVSQCFDLLLFVSCHVFLVLDFHLTGAAVFPGSQFISRISDSLNFRILL